jgi:Cft2 family RNA processing exonuclease
LASDIKEGKKKTINIDGLEIKNNAKTVILNSFTSHIQHKTMLELYSSFNAQEVYLVHGEKSNQYEFAQLLTDEYSNKNKTTRVFVPRVNDTIEF